jgi:hypothetical protein
MQRQRQQPCKALGVAPQDASLVTALVAAQPRSAVSHRDVIHSKKFIRHQPKTSDLGIWGFGTTRTQTHNIESSVHPTHCCAAKTFRHTQYMPCCQCCWPGASVSAQLSARTLLYISSELRAQALVEMQFCSACASACQPRKSQTSRHTPIVRYPLHSCGALHHRSDQICRRSCTYQLSHTVAACHPAISQTAHYHTSNLQPASPIVVCIAVLHFQPPSPIVHVHDHNTHT